MKTMIYIDAHLFRTSDGKVWAKTMYDYSFLKRYLEVFKTITVVSRIKSVDYRDVDGYLLTSGPGLTFEALPFVAGNREAWKYIYAIPKMKIIAKKLCGDNDCAIFRVPSIAGMQLLKQFDKMGKPYALEVVANPKNNAYGNGYLGKKIYRDLKFYSLRANGVSYVTQYALQQEFPSRAKINGSSKMYFEDYYSSIDLSSDFFATPRDYTAHHNKKFVIVHTANQIANYVKGHKELIEAVSVLIKCGYDIEIKFIGDGIKRIEFEEYARQLNISDRVSFTGILSSKERVRSELISSDLFVFPTKSEGLPRALIEAMAVGLPCISSPVDGIPELLEDKYLVAPNDISELSKLIEKIINDPIEMNTMSKTNINKAMEYSSECLQLRRNRFYSKLYALAEEQKD